MNKGAQYSELGCMGAIFLIGMASLLFSLILFVGFWPAIVFDQLPVWFRGFALLMWGVFATTGVILLLRKRIARRSPVVSLFGDNEYNSTKSSEPNPPNSSPVRPPSPWDYPEV